jgi:citrate synthase
MYTTEDSPLLTTEQVADRLGVKPATVYAYVSRGLLSSHRNADGKNSLFSKDDVDAFVAARKRNSTPTIQTGITLIKDGGLFYRGRDATVLAGTTSYEAVASLLWTGDLEHADFPHNTDLERLASAVTRPLPEEARLTDRLRVAVAAVAAADPLRFDTAPAAVVATGRQLISTMVNALPSIARLRQVKPASLAQALWYRLTAEPVTEEGLAILNAALVLLADHDLAASTLAARVAASTRAHPYAVVSAGLAALDGPLHGAASGLAYPMLLEAVNGLDPVAGISDRLRSGLPVPGFGHPLYPGDDPRAAKLFELLGDGPVRSTATRLAVAMRKRSGTAPNVDLALAAIALHYRMPPDAGEAIFAVARTAGWLAHALEEYGDRPSRFRPSGRYAGRQPV